MIKKKKKNYSSTFMREKKTITKGKKRRMNMEKEKMKRNNRGINKLT